MPLRRKPGDNAPIFRGEFMMRAQPPLMTSRIFTLLRENIEDFVQHKVSGRSFLIAGHRGSGKTTLAHGAIRQVVYDVLRQVMEDIQLGGTTIRRPIQRPFAVKLHGPSLVAAPRPSASGLEEVNAVLVQLTIGLYRALAEHAASRFLDHAQSLCLETGNRELLELAAQLRLDLDPGAEAALLRARWRQLGRLDLGVLWPSKVIERFPTRGQGMREIVALATAAQAFRVCTGAVTYTEGAKRSDSQEKRFELAARADAGNAAARVAALAAGGLVGAAAALGGAGAAGAAGAAIATSLGGALILNWSRHRLIKSESTSEHSFIRDMSVQTLDRDLPLVITRIRDAGLAPIFVVDELDKVDAQRETIRRIVARLKHLTTDFGFFMFLADRAVLEEIEQDLVRDPHAVEHSLFSHRILLHYGPLELGRLIADSVAGEPPTPPEVAALEIALLSNLALWRSRLNTIEAIRELDLAADADGRIVLWQVAYPLWLAAAVQIAISEVMRQGDLEARCARKPLFAQLLGDALYMIPRAWSAGEDTVPIHGPAIAKELMRRRLGRAPPEDSVGPIKATIGDADFALLVRAVGDLTAYLHDPAALLARIGEGSKERSADIQILKRTIPLLPNRRLLTRGDEPRTWRFACDINGVSNADLAPGAEVTQFRRDSIEKKLATLDAFETLLNDVELAWADIATAGFLGVAGMEGDRHGYLERLRGVVRDGRGYPGFDGEWRAVLLEAGGVEWQADEFFQLLKFIRLLKRALHDPADKNTAQANMPAVLAEMAQLLRASIGEKPVSRALALIAPDGFSSPVGEPPEGDDFPSRAAAFLKQMDLLVGPVLWDFDRAFWSSAASRFQAFAADRDPPKQVTSDDVLSRLLRRGPGLYLPLDLTRAGALDWSRLAAAAFPGAAKAGVPPWAFLAAIHALGFRGTRLSKVYSLVEQHMPAGAILSEAEQQLMARLIAPMDGPVTHFRQVPATLAIIAEAAAPIPPGTPEQPIFPLLASEAGDYIRVVAWLRENRFIEGVTDEL